MRPLQHKNVLAPAKLEQLLVQLLNGNLVVGTEFETLRETGYRIGELISELRELERVGRELYQRESGAKGERKKSWDGWPKFELSDSTSKELDRRGRRILEGINTRLRHYQWAPAVVALANEDGWPGFALSDYVQPVRDTFAFDFETSCVRAVMNLLVVGSLHQFRQCIQCKGWFHATIGRQKFCRDNCRKRYAACEQSFKEKRRLYMREYRIKEKSRDGNAKRLVKEK